MKIALYKSLKYGFASVYKAVGDMENDYDYLRLSEIVDVDFPMLPDVDVVKAQVNAIDNAIEKEQADSHVRIESMNQRKQELLAIGFKE